MIFTEGLQSQLCGRGDDAVHTTFEGDVIVTLPSTQGGVPVQGTVRDITLNFRSPTPRRAMLESRAREG